MQDFGTLALRLPNGERQEFTLSKGVVSIGRAPTSDIALRDPKASRAHTRLECGPEGCFVVDLGSANGTLVNGAQVQRVQLRPGDRIAIGDCILQYQTRAVSQEFEATRIDTEVDLEKTLAVESLMTVIGEVNRPRLAIRTPARTWEITLDKEVVTIGRRSDNDVALESPASSRYHARIERVGNGFILRDLNSDNGTWLQSERITKHVLEDGDTIRIGDARLIFKAGFIEEDLTIVGARAMTGPKRPVVVIPGFMGSNLWLGSQQIWPNVRQLFRDPDILRYGEGTPYLEPRGLVDEVVVVPGVIKQEQYGGLIHYLEEALGYERGKDLLDFAYDFRQDVRISAQQLAVAVENWNVKAPVTIIAHSMGSLLSRYYVDRLGGHRRVERLVLLGGPMLGAPKTVLNLAIGADLLPFGVMGTRLRDVLMTFPSIYQLLPSYPCCAESGAAINWLSDELWVPENCRPFVRTAAQFRSELRPSPAVPTVCVFGYNLKTVTSLHVERNGSGMCDVVEGVIDLGGDGSIPESSATFQGVEIHPVQQYHGTLHVDQDVKKRLKLELTR